MKYDLSLWLTDFDQRLKKEANFSESPQLRGDAGDIVSVTRSQENPVLTWKWRKWVRNILGSGVFICITGLTGMQPRGSQREVIWEHMPSSRYRLGMLLSIPQCKGWSPTTKTNLVPNVNNADYFTCDSISSLWCNLYSSITKTLVEWHLQVFSKNSISQNGWMGLWVSMKKSP